MDIGSFYSELVRMNCVKCAFLLVLLQPLVAVSLSGVMVNNRLPIAKTGIVRPRQPLSASSFRGVLVNNRPPLPKSGIVRPRQPVAASVPVDPKTPSDGNKWFHYQDIHNPGKQVKLVADISIFVFAKYKGKLVESKQFFEDDFLRTAGTYNNGSTVVYFKLPPAYAFFKIKFEPFRPPLAANQQHILPGLMFRPDTMFPDLEDAEGFVCFNGPEGTIADSIGMRDYEQTPCGDHEPLVSEYEYSVSVEVNTLRIEENPTSSLRASDDKQSARASVGVTVGVVMAVVAVVAVAAAVGLVVRRRANAATATSEKSGLVTLTLS